jgi:hypothetical protein
VYICEHRIIVCLLTENMNISPSGFTGEAQPFSNAQRELLALFSHDIPEQHLIELKTVIARFLMERAIAEATSIWEERTYTSQEHIQEARSGIPRAAMQ